MGLEGRYRRIGSFGGFGLLFGSHLFTAFSVSFTYHAAHAISLLHLLYTYVQRRGKGEFVVGYPSVIVVAALLRVGFGGSMEGLI